MVPTVQENLVWNPVDKSCMSVIVSFYIEMYDTIYSIYNMSIRLYIMFVLIGFGCKLLCQRVSTEAVAGSTKLRQSK